MGSSRWFTIGLITSWYASNIGVLLLNKYLLSNYGFRYPIFLTLCHMLACSLLSYAAIAWLKVVPRQNVRSRAQFVKISVLSLVFCASVVSGNVSLRFLPVSFNQAIGATTPFFTAVFACIMTRRREALLTYFALIPVVAGVIIASGGRTKFSSVWIYNMYCCYCRTGAQVSTSRNFAVLRGLNSMNLLMYMAPVAVAFLLPAALLMEENVVNITLALARDDVRILWYLIFNSALAYLVNLTNFLVTKHTSALTLQVLGNAKGAVAVVVSILIFRNPVSITGMLGYSLTLIGVVLYSEAKKRSK
ncbi:putative sugar phosphate/phosphate translocator [Vitis vinifera]|uniref:Putative sugar phosphate/phosphate translocator n=1 Tax=Vitis vinifera TaxID=29760 RepID=A0A438F9P0_VITVI|nr:putative sugar phosphate/phosphate translocator [Vitis vinifera]